MIFDTHAHIYPAKIAHKASRSIESFYDLPVDYEGDVETLVKIGDDAGIDRFLVHSVATTPEQVEHINDFIAASVASSNGRFIGFCAMHPDYDNPGRELDRMIALGIKGIKLHPDFQKFMIDDEKAFAMYDAAAERGLPILFHMGDRRYEYSKASRLYRVVEKFPELKCIGAHLGGYSEWDEAAEVLRGTGIWVDTSSSLSFMTPEHARELIDVYGTDRVMFASDYPMWSSKNELELFSKIPMTEAERERMLWSNAVQLLGTDI